MVVRVNYKIKQPLQISSIDTSAYPIKSDDACLDIEPLQNLCDELQDFIAVLKNAKVIIKYADGNRLFDIYRAICQELTHGEDELDAIINVSAKHTLPLHVVFLAYSLAENYRYTYEKFIISHVMKILSDLGFKPMQIYKKIREIPNVSYTYRGILEELKAWQDGEYKAFTFFEHNASNLKEK